MTALPVAEDVRARMDRMYRPQVAIYDLTRKYYLLGRDRLIAELGARPGERVLEIGCGTGRNLVAIGRRYPGVQLEGVDAASPMLTSAARALLAAGLRARLEHGLAEELGAFAGADHIVVSYCWSMVDDPAAAVRAAVEALRPGGTLHVVDFADQAGLPAWFRRLLAVWLAQFHVRYRSEVEAELRALETAGRGRLRIDPIARRYALLFRFTRAA